MLPHAKFRDCHVREVGKSVNTAQLLFDRFQQTVHLYFALVGTSLAGNTLM